MTFHVGQKVVCVDNSDTDDGDQTIISVGGEYTVAWIGFYEDRWHGGRYSGMCVHLAEVKRGPPDGDAQYAVVPYRASRFRPAIKRSTDTGMAILKKIARDAKPSVPARVPEHTKG